MGILKIALPKSFKCSITNKRKLQQPVLSGCAIGCYTASLSMIVSKGLILVTALLNCIIAILVRSLELVSNLQVILGFVGFLNVWSCHDN